ncbi:autotransporter assembly complex protein TamA [Parerythrobacter aestuarii]|uniref:autotransporter assembly complex protein TamA n=1 Tax=Parerythrobacter aestuarii TaxID=3020909 RepID=UPI0024DEA127|nr:BamA/TamA family outer membrane protein [Parerythrobacter aestuarii]
MRRAAAPLCDGGRTRKGPAGWWLALPLLGASPGLAAQDQPALDIPSPPADADLPATEPVIDDEEFDSSIPDLVAEDDPELDRPMESIAEFERRIAAEQGEIEDMLPLGDPTLADGDAVEAIADAPIRDAELVAPLPPLESFDVAPVEFAEAANDEETVEVAYSVSLTGLDEADRETDANLRDMFKDFSALRRGDGNAANIAQVAARLREDTTLVERILASEGWFAGSVETRIDRSDTREVTAVIEVAPGQRFSLGSITLDAGPVEPTDLLRDNFPLVIGEPIVATRVQAAEALLAFALPQNGYPFAELGQRDILLDRETGEGEYSLPVETGPRARFGAIRTTGKLAFDAAHIEVLKRFERGDLYDSRDIDDLRQALVATGLLSAVSVRPERSGEQAEDGTEYATILVEQTAGPPRSITASAGYGTGEGFRVEGSWSHRNLFPPEGALIASAVLGTEEQGASVTFRRSNAGKRDRTFQLTAEALHSNLDAYEAYTGRLAALISYDSTPIWQKPFTYAFGVQLIGTNEQDFDPATGGLVRQTFFIGGLTGQVGIDRTDSLLDPTRGFKATMLVEPEGSLDGGFTFYTRAQLDASAYLPASENLVLAGRVRIGTIQGIERFELAPSRRFYGGGGGSVRGFGYQELGPRAVLDNPRFDPTDPEETASPFLYRPIGGRSLVEAAAEVRYRFGDYGVVGFVDAGQVYEASTPDFSDIRFGVGVGARYYTNFGPLRVDFAIPLDKREGENSFALYIGIGQAF